LSSGSVARVVSGGQSGADRAALDAAVGLGLEYGGWCPLGGAAEDFPEPPGLLTAYPRLRETADAAAETRTRWNVRDSDATLVLSLTKAHRSPGTRLTLDVAQQLGRPHVSLPANRPDLVRSWLEQLEHGSTLNVAGPRESEDPGIYATAYATLVTVLAAR
jgi:hypothetical protein